MDDNGGLGMRHWGGYYEQPQVKGNLSLQLMSAAGERDLKPVLHNGAPFLQQRDCVVQEPSVPIEYLRESWMYHQRDNSKILHDLTMNPSYAFPPDAHAQGIPHTLQMLEQPEPALAPATEKAPAANGSGVKKGSAPRKKRPREVNPSKVPKPKKPAKASTQKAGMNTENKAASRAKAVQKSVGVVINGIDLDISQLPAPVCSCTGTRQQCYRWGIGGWQSACCTTNMSVYPLPMSTKKRGARIAGRKMSQGAFKKVLEKLAGEGYNLANPIDLRNYWAKHGTNKFVTIR